LERLEPDDLIEYDVASQDDSMIELPDDFVLREIFEVDLTPEGIAAFTNKWGPMVPYGKNRLACLRGVHYRSDAYDDEADLRRWLEVVDKVLDQRAAEWIIPVHLIKLHVMYLRGMAAHLKVYFDGGDLEDYQVAYVSHGLNEPHQESTAWMWFESILNAALTPYHAHVNSDPALTGALTGGRPMPTLYQACALQIYNYIVEGVPFSRCANETCRGLFTKQRGRAQYGEDNGGWNRSKGVKYCSHRCAKAQSERERRRRLRREATPSK
jgi:hypothetical protein